MLPLVVLTLFGLFSLRQDRLLAEQAARAGGQSLAQQLAQAIGSESARQLRDYREASFDLEANRSTDLGLSQWKGGAIDESNAWQRVNQWQQANPEIDLLKQPTVEPSSYYEQQPETMPPQPPPWLSELNPQQQQLWQAAKQAEFGSQDDSQAGEALQKFMASNPPEGARANAEYLLLLTKTRNQTDAEAVSHIAEFSRTHWGNADEHTDAGLPLGQLICYQALRRLPDGAGLPESFIRHHTIAWMIQYSASFFSPVLISEAERVARGTPQAAYAATLKSWWQANATARTVLQDFCEQYPTNTWKPEPFWVSSRAGKYLILLGDRLAVSTNEPEPAKPRQAYLMFPEAVVKHALAAAVKNSELAPTPYARVELELGGKTVALSHNQFDEATNSLLPLLGQANGQWQNLPLNTNVYPFRVRVALVSPEILYAHQRQRTWLFGALIVFSAGAAALGLFAAWRSFRREQQLNELKTNFVSSVSHELRAPIASVRLMAENLERGKIPEASRQNEYFRFIVQECRRLSALIENVLDFSRIEQGRKQYEFEPTNVAALVETTVKLMEPYAAEKGVALQWKTPDLQPPAFLPELNMDGRAMQQALVNLIDNAIKHSPKGGTVVIEAGNTKDGTTPAVMLSVADRGPGIPREEHDKIFERFYRRGSELRRETQGVGIGLSVVKHIVEAHGGRVTVQSDVGQGSRFTIELPVISQKQTKETKA